MRYFLRLYLLLSFSVIVQMSFMNRFIWFPDFILLMVVFVGIFRNSGEGAIFGLVAGILRGVFSLSTLSVDIFIFPIIGSFCWIISGMFYRKSPIGQMFTVFIALVFIITCHILFINFTNTSNVSLIKVIISDWRQLIVTTFFSPIFFIFLNRLTERDRFRK